MKTAYATIKGFEVMRMFKKGRFEVWKYGQGIYNIELSTHNIQGKTLKNHTSSTICNRADQIMLSFFYKKMGYLF